MLRLNHAPSFYAAAPNGTTAVCVLAVFVLSALIGCDASHSPSADEKPVDEPELDSFAAETFTLAPKTWPTVVRSQGSLYADEETVVGTKVAGRVASVHVDLGDFVEAGTPLITLDLQEFQVQLEQSEAQLRQARFSVGLAESDDVKTLDPERAPPVREAKAQWDETKSALSRAERLREQNAIAEGELEQAEAAEQVAEARYASALNGVREKIALIGVRQAEVSLARQQLDDAVIKAPLDGFVRQRSVAVGTYVSVGQSIAVMVRTHPLRFRGTVPERHAQSLAIGQDVELQIESVGPKRLAKISRISPSLDQVSRALVYEAEIDNQDHQLRTGLFVEAEIVIDSNSRSLTIPESALIQFAGTQKVWKVVDGVAGEQEVLTGSNRNGAWEIIDGLSEGDVILAEASRGRVARILSQGEVAANAERDAETSASAETTSADSASVETATESSAEPSNSSDAS